MTQRKGLLRNTDDKFYTKPETVDFCIKYIENYLDLKDQLVIEPSAGNGSFINAIKKLTSNFHFFDISPDHPEIKKQDYLKLDYACFKNAHIIGNPPFGRQSSLAIKFIKKSCEFCESISFILPKSFKKDTLRRSFHLHFHLLFEIDLPEKSFLVNEKEHDVPCVFQIWKRETTPRKITKVEEPVGFSFVKKTEKPDLSFRRVGVNAGTFDTNVKNKSESSHYFLKTTGSFCFDGIVFENNNTVGPRSISKQELIRELNRVNKVNQVIRVIQINLTQNN